MRTTEPKPLHRDPEALTALVIAVALTAAPGDTFDRVVDNPAIFGTLLGIVFGGRYGLRFLDSRSVSSQADIS